MVNLRNGNSISTSICGDVKLSNELIFKGVLYLPQFEVNLIAVAKLCKEHNCTLVFETGRCVIQAKRDLKKIGSARELDGLYYLDAPCIANKAVFVSSIFTHKGKDKVAPAILWHLRLWHLSHDGMQCMSFIYSYIPNSVHKACDVCEQAR